MTSPSPALPEAALVLELGRALHRYGTPAHRLEDTLTIVSRQLGLEGQFFSTPTAIMAGFGPLGAQHASLVRVEPGTIDLEKMALVHALSDELRRGATTPAAAHARLRAIDAAPPRFGAAAMIVAFGLASGCSAVFFGGGIAEAIAGFAIGTLIGLIAIVTARAPRASRVFELVASFMAALVAGLGAHYVAPFSVFVATLAGLIVLVPGLTLTVAMTELATRHYVSGSARLTASGIVFLEIIFGVALGGKIAEAITREPPGLHEPVPLPSWAILAALVISAFALMVLFRARPRAFGWILGAGSLAFLGARGGAIMLGPELGTLLGAVLLGVATNLYARFRRRPAAEPAIPGMLLLVPGSLGFRSLSAFLGGDAAGGIDSAFSMLMVALAIVAGLLVANAAVPQRGTL